MSTSVIDLATYGDARSRDNFFRHGVQTVQAADALTPIEIQSSFLGIKADTTTQFDIARITAVEKTADGTDGQVKIYTNPGTGNTLSTSTDAVAVLSNAAADYYSTAVGFHASATGSVTADFATGYTAAFTKGTQGATAATVLTLAPGTSNTAVTMKATSDKINVNAADVEFSNRIKTAALADIGGNINVRGNTLAFTQSGGTAGYKVSGTTDQYAYDHTNGVGNRVFNLDPKNVDNTTLTSGAYVFNSFNAGGTAEAVLSMGGGASTGNQAMTISNSYVGIGETGTTANRLAVTGDTKLTGKAQITSFTGIGQAPSATDILAVTGSSKFTGSAEITSDLTVGGSLTVNGTLTTISTTDLKVEDTNILLADGATTRTLLANAGLTLGTGATDADRVTWYYDNDLIAWHANVGLNADAGNNITIAGGVAAGATGVTLNASGLEFGNTAGVISMGPIGSENLKITPDEFTFLSANAIINFGNPAVASVTKDGFSSSGADSALTLGNKWKIQITNTDGKDYLSFKYNIGTVLAPDYQTKFTIQGN